MKSRLKKIAERQGNDWYAYHGADLKNKESILKNGLRAGGSGFIYLSYNKNMAWTFAKKHPNPIVFKVQLDGFNMQEVVLNNHDKPFYEVTKDYFEKNMIDSKEYKELYVDVPYNGNIAVFLEDLQLENGEIYLKWINDLLEYYIDDLNADVMVSIIRPNQIIDVEE